MEFQVCRVFYSIHSSICYLEHGNSSVVVVHQYVAALCQTLVLGTAEVRVWGRVVRRIIVDRLRNLHVRFDLIISPLKDA